MISFLTTSILGLIILGAIGSIVGYLLILLSKKAFRSILLLNKNFKQLRFEIFKKKYVKDFVETIILFRDGTDNTILLTKLIIDFVSYLGIIIICFLAFIQLLIFSMTSSSPDIKTIAFLIGLISSFPLFKLGYIRGRFAVIYRSYIERKANEIGLENIENKAIEKYNSKH